MIKYLVLLHVATGIGAVLGMTGALATKKGGANHRLAGKLYTISMALALLLALIVSAITVNIFLFLIGVFSAYFVYTGWRLAVQRDSRMSQLDQRLAQLMVAFAVAMTGYGIYQTISGDHLAVALAVFGVFAFLPAWADYKRDAMWPTGKDRIVLHLGRMGGASIATITAVLVVNVKTNPEFIAWLLPSVIGTPLIIYWSRRTAVT